MIVGCQTQGVLIKETPLNLSESRRIIASIIGQPKMMSQNGREMKSRFYDRRGRYLENIENAKERLYTVVTVLGDRRPYDVKVEVFVEEKVEENVYVISEQDNRSAERIAARIKDALYQSQSNRNVIDDFRPL
ncbi:MAG: hypothetical protein JNM39_05870 [Bdellovibrionaceae bacterium]|nr:hypothetical protein [Pseudobdellovibrionaceae bacterium]